MTSSAEVIKLQQRCLPNAVEKQDVRKEPVYGGDVGEQGPSLNWKMIGSECREYKLGDSGHTISWQ